jgi:hypothetical protein
MFKTIRQLRRSLGLQRAGLSDFAMPALGILAVGLLAGAGIALMVAPTTGKKLREDMERMMGDLRSRFILPQGDENIGRRNNLGQKAEPSSHA